MFVPQQNMASRLSLPRAMAPKNRACWEAAAPATSFERALAYHCGVCTSATRSSSKCPRQRSRKSGAGTRSEEHTSELQSLMRLSYAVFCLKKNTDTEHKALRQ